MSLHQGLVQHEYVQKLRQNQTPSELRFKHLLSDLARETFPSLSYFKQSPFRHDKGFYIVDFLLPHLKLGFELDGGYHFKQIDKDLKRDYFFMSKNIVLYHFPNSFILRKGKLKRLAVKSIVAYIIAKHMGCPFNIPTYLKQRLEHSDYIYFKIL